ncbi:hypothetical protein OC844_001038, partial [Tilletia horrida]
MYSTNPVIDDRFPSSARRAAPADLCQDPSPRAARRDGDKSISDLDREVVEMHRVIKPSGLVFYRSAAKRPWYNQRFEKAGFKVEPVHIRETGQPTDN